MRRTSRSASKFKRRFQLESLEQRLPLASDVLISEFQAINQSTITDEDGDSSDWIEIQNVGASPVNLVGWSLTDDVDDLSRWRFPEVTLAPNSFLLVFASGKDRTNASELHANFSLSADGEYLALVRPDGQTIVSEFQYPVQVAGNSYGVIPSGENRLFSIPTPGSANGSQGNFRGVAADPEFNFDSGFYDNQLSVEISSTPNATIRYTLDATAPNEQSLLYIDPIPISGTTIVRAASFESDYLSIGDVSRSYLFLDDVLVQDGEGLPETWGTFSNNSPLGVYRAGDAVPANYGVDPEVVNDPRYRDTIKDDLKSIPSLSLVFDPEDLWSEETGIYSNTMRSGINWERPVTAELIDTDGSVEFQVDAGARIHGGFSRRADASAKHSIRLLFKADYGPTKLEYPWFGEEAAADFDTVVLRASYNFSWARGERNNTQHAADGTFVQDRWAAVAQDELGGLAPDGTWVHLYINGLYWGLYNPNERPSAPFQADYQGGDKEDYDVLKIGEVVDGDRKAWNELLSLVRQDSVDYGDVSALLDVPGFIDYMMINHFGGNEDWPHNNWYASRKREDGAKWQFHSWDAEFLFRDLNTNRVNETNSNVRGGPGEIYNRLRTNTEFRVEFSDHIQKHFFNEGAFTPAANIARFEQVLEPIDRAIVGESARWGDSLFDNIDPALTRDDHWLPRIEQLKTEYFPQRTNVVLQQYRDVGLYPDLNAPVFSQHGGSINPDFSLTIEPGVTTAGTVYYTTDGTDPRLPGGAVNPSAIAYDSPIRFSTNTQLQARVINGADWSALESATFVIDNALPLRISEVMYHPQDPAPNSPFDADDFEFIEVTNISAEAINPVGAAFVDGVEFTFPSITIGPSEHVVVVRDVDAFQSRYGTEPVIAGEFSDGKLSNSGETISLVDARGALIVEFNYEDSQPWPQRADGVGASLEIIDAQIDTGFFDAPTSWRGSTQPHGSPGEAGSETIGVVINEVSSRTTGTGFLDSIELLNTTDSPIDIGGWFLSDSANNLLKYRIPAGTTLGSKEYAVFDEQHFNPTPTTPLPTHFALNGRQGDQVWLVIPNESTGTHQFVDEVSFGVASAGETWGRFPDGEGGFSPLVRSRLGRDNAPPRVGPLIVSEIQYAPGEPSANAIALDPTIEKMSLEFVEIHNPTYSDQMLGNWRLRGGTKFDFPDIVLPALSSLVIVPFSPDSSPSLAAAFRAHYGVSENVKLVGGWDGQLDNNGEPIHLERPSTEGEAILLSEDSFYYNDTQPWPLISNNNSLHRLTASSPGDNSQSWTSGLPSPGAVSLNSAARGDFSGDGRIDTSDVDLLFAASHSNNRVAQFDLNEDQTIDLVNDVTILIEDILNTRRGDTNLDGDVDFADFLQLSSNFGQTSATWSDGDFNGDGEVGFADFLLLSTEFGFVRT